MKRSISNIILFILSITFCSCIYIGSFKVSIDALCILFIIFALYGFCMGLGWKSIEKLRKYEQKSIHFCLTKKDDVKILLFSLTSLSPTYFCVILLSLVPLYTYEVWFITVFPCIFLNCLPAISVLEEYYELTYKKSPFLVLFFMITVAFCLMGVIASSLIMKK